MESKSQLLGQANILQIFRKAFHSSSQVHSAQLLNLSVTQLYVEPKLPYNFVTNCPTAIRLIFHKCQKPLSTGGILSHDNITMSFKFFLHKKCSKVKVFKLFSQLLMTEIHTRNLLHFTIMTISSMLCIHTDMLLNNTKFWSLDHF